MVKLGGVKYSPVESDRAMAERGGVKHSPLESGRAMVECSGVQCKVHCGTSSIQKTSLDADSALVLLA